MNLDKYIEELKSKGYKGKYYIFFNTMENKYYSYSEYIEKQNPQLYLNIDLKFIKAIEIN